MIWHNAEIHRAEIARLEARLRRTEEAFERVVDNVLSASGARPIFHPEAERFQPRPLPERPAGAAGEAPVSRRDLRSHLEASDREKWRLERRRQLAAELQAITQERTKEDQ